MTGTTPAQRVRQAARSGNARQSSAPTPPGWVYNPSAWRQRIPIAVLAIAGFAVAGWLALFQMGVVATVWEPFFGSGSRRILTGAISNLLPIPDAALGALGYVADAVFGLVGGRGRWKTMPWVVVIFAIAVIPFGLTSVTLFILQPVAYAGWCTLCLISVAISLAMVPYAWDEFVASWQWTRGRVDAGAGWWGALLGR
jgi:uncharacterized membrane protein